MNNKEHFHHIPFLHKSGTHKYFHLFKPQKAKRILPAIALAGILFCMTSCQFDIPGNQLFPAPSPAAANTASSGSMEVHVLDVGQGLSVWIRSGDSCLLYDGGNEAASSFVVSHLQRHGVEQLDYVVASHYDSDHLSGIVGALNAFPTETLLAPGYEADTPVYQSFLTAAEEKQLSPALPVSGAEYALGDGSFEILAPLGTEYEDENDYSIVLKVSIGGQSLLLTGDASRASEQEMLSLGNVLDSDVLVIGHHGSSGSTQEEFLDAVSPDYTIVSCGLGNDYGHPAQRVVTLLSDYRLPLYRTDIQGTIDFVMTPEEILFPELPSGNYTAGRDMPLDGSDFHAEDYTYILNTRTHKFHLPDCGSVSEMSVRNRRGSDKSREDLIREGYDPCGTCRP